MTAYPAARPPSDGPITPSRLLQLLVLELWAELDGVDAFAVVVGTVVAVVVAVVAGVAAVVGVVDVAAVACTVATAAMAAESVAEVAGAAAAEVDAALTDM
ncbi:MAG: hypothetical protein JJD93_16710 [Ilumatobacteraceae bacterium]|nr:hypothetical protein [Ilumatobacteraceae bacterium]